MKKYLTVFIIIIFAIIVSITLSSCTIKVGTYYMTDSDGEPLAEQTITIKGNTATLDFYIGTLSYEGEYEITEEEDCIYLTARGGTSIIEVTKGGDGELYLELGLGINKFIRYRGLYE